MSGTNQVNEANQASIERGIHALKEQIDSTTAAFFSSCTHCGMCADACLYHTETDDPSLIPIYKVEPMRRLWEQEYTLVGRAKKMLGISKQITDEELEQWRPLVYDSCSLCGRCSMVCPVGNDISGMIRKMREGMSASGNAPEGLIGASTRAIETGSPMGVKLPAVQAQIKHAVQDTGLEYPMDKEGAEYLVLLSSLEIMNYPEYLQAIAKIFHQTGKTWTLSSEAFEATNAGIQIGSSDIAAELVGRVVNAADTLKVKTVISPECGHAYTAIRWEGPNLIGKEFSFKVQHILEVLDDLRKEGSLKTEGVDESKLTFHDPCQLVRKGGVVEQPRNLLNMVSTNFVEMDDSGVMNWCCGGGGGVSSNEDADEIRAKAFNRKKRQIQDLEVETLVTACANCRMNIEDGLEVNEMDMPVLGLTEMIAEYLVVPETQQKKEETV